MVESLRHSRIELVLTRHEQAAAFMAATQGRLTGRPGVCLSTLGPGRAEFHHRRRLCPSRRHADADDHRPEGDQERTPGALPDRRHRRRDAAADQDDAADRLGRRDPDHGARRLPRRGRGASRASASRTAGGHRRRGGRRAAGAAASARPAGRLARGARSRRRHDPGSQAPADHDRRRRQPAAAGRRAVRFRAADAHPLLQHPDGQGRRDRRLQSLSRHRGAVRARLRS